MHSISKKPANAALAKLDIQKKIKKKIMHTSLNPTSTHPSHNTPQLPPFYRCFSLMAVRLCICFPPPPPPPPWLGALLFGLSLVLRLALALVLAFPLPSACCLLLHHDALPWLWLWPLLTLLFLAAERASDALPRALLVPVAVGCCTGAG